MNRVRIERQYVKKGGLLTFVCVSYALDGKPKVTFIDVPATWWALVGSEADILQMAQPLCLLDLAAGYPSAAQAIVHQWERGEEIGYLDTGTQFNPQFGKWIMTRPEALRPQECYTLSVPTEGQNP